MSSHGEKRLFLGFEKVLEEVEEVLSKENFLRALRGQDDPEVWRKVLIETFKENSFERLRELCNEYKLFDRLSFVESKLRQPGSKKGNWPTIQKESVLILMRIIVLGKKKEYDSELKQRIEKLKKEKLIEEEKLEENRKRIKTTLQNYRDLNERFKNFHHEEADTEDE